MRKSIYLAFAIPGFLLPYYFLLRFLGEHGFDITLLIQQLFANDISTFFAIDLVISIVVFWVWMHAETNKFQMKNAWLYVLASLTVGLSFALPLFLYFRERQLESR